MRLPSPVWVTRWAWITFGLYWLVAAFGGKKTKRRESRLSRITYTLPLLAAYVLLIWRKAHQGWLGAPFLPVGNTTKWIGVVITVAGVGLAIWARRMLGGNWSGTVTLKENHELIRSGPYKRIRHPIYTGILLALLGTAVTLNYLAGLLSLALAWSSFWWKARREESFLKQEFGARFEAHQKQTGMFLPKLS